MPIADPQLLTIPQTWRLEKLGYHTPIEAREEYELRQAA